MSLTLRSVLLFIAPPAAPPPTTGYAPMDVIWLLALLLCVLGALPLEIVMLGMR